MSKNGNPRLAGSDLKLEISRSLRTLDLPHGFLNAWMITDTTTLKPTLIISGLHCGIARLRVNWGHISTIDI